MQKRLIRLSSVFILLVMTFMLSSFTVAAETEPPQQRTVGESKNYLSVSGIRSKTLSAYNTVTVYVNGRTAGYSGRLISGTVYIPIKRFVEANTAARTSYDSVSKILYVTGSGYNIYVTDGAYVLYASERPIFSMTPSVVLSDGNMYVPAETLAKAFGMRISSESSRSISVSGTAAPILSANKFYREDEVYWLARIINAESRGESLLGQIAVGNVVLNRVKSPLYPNTIWSVIFDKKYGVQFSPILDGSIYNEPGYTSLLAAKICLEGFSLSSDALFFLYPRASTSSWIPNNREYAFSIGKHDFYK